MQQDRKPWVTSSFDEPDLLHANEYYREHMENIGSYYQPHPAMVPCGSVDKPAIFVKVPDGAFEAFANRVTIGQFTTQALGTETYAVLWMRLFVRDPNGEAIRAMVPGVIGIATPDADLSTVPLDLFLDVADPDVERWVEAWSQWPNAIFFFLLEGRDRVASYFHLDWPPNGATETILNSVREAREFLRSIPQEKRDFKRAVIDLRRSLKCQ